MKTEVCEKFGIEFPLFAFSHCRDVVAAVTNAGGLGVLGAVAYTPERLEEELRWIDDHVGGRPYGVDVLVPGKIAKEADAPGGLDALLAAVPAEHWSFLTDLFERYGVPAGERPRGGGGGAGRQVTKQGATELIDVALKHPIRLIASALGPPPPLMVERARTAGVPVAALVGTVEHARRQVEAGADLIVAQGGEAGGHTGEISTMVLVPEVVDAVAPLPVLAAGGIGSGRQMAAAMALGASGVWCGSVWLTTEEAETLPAVKAKMLAATSSDTVRSRSRTGKPARQLRSAWTEEWDSARQPRPAADAAPDDRRRGRDGTDRQGRRGRQRGRPAAGELLRRPGGRPDEHRQTRAPGGLRHDRGVRRGLGTPEPDHRRVAAGPAET